MKKKLLFLLFIIIIFFKATDANAQVLAQDSVALVNLYDSCDGVHWNHFISFNWLVAGKPVSTWQGVTVTGNRVTGIDLTIAGVKGAIPYTLGNLDALTVLDLSSPLIVPGGYFYIVTSFGAPGLPTDGLSGPVPESFANLTHLTYLNLSGNSLISGAIPLFFGNYKNLKNLNLAGNSFTGTIPDTLTTLKHLDTLDLSQNQFSGSLPEQIGDLDSLTFLNLSYNNFSGDIPASIGKLSSLQFLALNHSPFASGTGIPDTLRNCTQLQTLIMGGIPFKGTIPSWLADLPNLKNLLLSGDSLTGSIPASFANGNNLRYLFLSDNQLTGTIPPGLCNYPIIEALLLGNNKLTGTIPDLWSSPIISYIDFSNNQLTGNLPASFGAAPVANSLEFIFFSHNQLTGNIPDSWNKIKNLIELDLSYNQLSGNLPGSFTDLDMPLFNSDGLANVPNGSNLNLSNNHFSGPIPYNFGSNKNNSLVLSGPDFSNNEFTEVPTSFKLFTEIISLYNNHLVFDSLEQVVAANPLTWDVPQATIPLHLNGNTLSVYAGGTLANNTFHWYKNNLPYQTIVGDSTLTITTNGSYSVSVTNSIVTSSLLPGVGDLTLYSDTVSYTALPLTLISFTGNKEGSRVKLLWTTTNETDFSHFEVERSADGINFSPLGSVQARNTPSINNYQLYDDHPFATTNFYRLKMVDIDNSYSYSRIIRIDFDKNFALNIAPNPAHDYVVINGADQYNYIQFIDVNGKVVEQFIKPSGNLFSIANLKSGVYFVRLSSNDDVQILKLIKQ